MAQLGTLEAGSRHDLRVGQSPDAPDEADFHDDGEGAFGYVHSYETSSRYDGPGLRAILFLSGCLLRCSYCHNPDTWHLKDGTYISAQHVIDRLGTFAPALRSLDGGLTISGGEVMVQTPTTRWDDVGGVDEVRERLREGVELPAVFITQSMAL